MDMTDGNILGQLIRFALPLLLGNLFQQLYNMVDTWVIGQTGDNAAYAAVGNVGPVTNIMVGFFVGFSTGAGVVISQYFGKKDFEMVKKAVHTAVAVTGILCVVFTAAGVLMTPTVLRLMLHVDPADPASMNVYYPAKRYLTIYFAGISGLLLYNIGAGILRAVGDSTRPFIFLCVSTATNIALDIVFVFLFDWGVTGVGLATVTSQFASAVFAAVTLLRTDGCVKVKPSALRIDGPILGKLVTVGLPAGLQTALTAFSNVFVQSYISGADGVQEINMSAWTTYSKVDAVIFLPLQSLALSVTTFVGQNLGRNNVERARKGCFTAYFMALTCTVGLIVPIWVFAPYIAPFFNASPDVVERAVMLLRFITPFALCSCANQIFSGAMRGAGNSTAPMIIMLSNFVGMRQIYLFVMTRFISNALLPIGMGYPFGWLCCMITTLVYYRFFFSYTGKKLV